MCSSCGVSSGARPACASATRSPVARSSAAARACQGAAPTAAKASCAARSWRPRLPALPPLPTEPLAVGELRPRPLELRFGERSCRRQGPARRARRTRRRPRAALRSARTRRAPTFVRRALRPPENGSSQYAAPAAVAARTPRSGRGRRGPARLDVCPQPPWHQRLELVDRLFHPARPEGEQRKGGTGSQLVRGNRPPGRRRAPRSQRHGTRPRRRARRDAPANAPRAMPPQLAIPCVSASAIGLRRRRDGRGEPPEAELEDAPGRPDSR